MSDINLTRNFQKFGKNVHTIAILMILSFPFPFLIIGILVLMGKLLKNLKNINIILNNKNLLEFYTKYKYSAVLRVIGLLFTAGSITAFTFTLRNPLFFNPWYILIILICSIMILFAGSVSEAKAWEDLKYFIEENAKLFPSEVLNDSIDGCSKLRKGSLIYYLWFLVIPILIGFGFQVKGFFKLSKLKDLTIF
ncbi:MAG: hypothetical protein ACFFC1_07370 [Promethearchaeota archaeon]